MKSSTDRVPVFKLLRAGLNSMRVISKGIKEAKQDDGSVSADEAASIVANVIELWSDVFDEYPE